MLLSEVETQLGTELRQNHLSREMHHYCFLTVFILKLGFFFPACVSGDGMETHSQVVDRLRSTFRSGVTVPERFRRTQLTNLMSMIQENEQQILDALHKDLAKVLQTTASPIQQWLF